nr:unnamed protein product [Callosobruchus chinensis]
MAEAAYFYPILDNLKNHPNPIIAYGVKIGNGGMTFVNRTAEEIRTKPVLLGDWSGFDHTIPAWLIRDAFRILADQTPVYTAHSKNDISNIPETPKVGKHLKHKIPDEDINVVKEHIESFPKVESHYCRSNTQTDRCDVCEEVKLKKKENTFNAEKNQEYEKHIEEKEATRNEKRKDRESGEACLVFDLQNVLSCPKAKITNFFRKRKLTLYNLTAILSSTKQVYCAEWHELLMGRSGNDLATSALIRILEAVFAGNRNLNNLIL